MTYDPASYELAEYFLAGLPSTKEDIDSLAQTIQSAIEDWLHDFEEKFEPRKGEP